MSASIFIAILAFIAIGGVGVAFAGGGEKANQKRVKAIANGRIGEARKPQIDAATLKRKQNTQDALKQMTKDEQESRKRRLSIQGQLDQAGVSASPSTFWIASAGLGVICTIAGLILQGPIGAAIGAIVGGLGLPRWVLKFLVGARQKKFASQLSDAIDVIVRGVKSGLPLSQCLRIIGAESPDPLKSEFNQLVDAQAMGVPLDQALMRMYERMPLPEVNFFAIVLTIQQKTGGNLSESLGNLSGVLRARKLVKEKVKALSAEAKASAMIIGALPFIVMGMVYLTKPDYIMTLFTAPMGHLILIGSAVMMSAGILVMRNMINFKF